MSSGCKTRFQFLVMQWHTQHCWCLSQWAPLELQAGCVSRLILLSVRNVKTRRGPAALRHLSSAACASATLARQPQAGQGFGLSAWSLAYAKCRSKPATYPNNPSPNMDTNLLFAATFHAAADAAALRLMYFGSDWWKRLMPMHASVTSVGCNPSSV